MQSCGEYRCIRAVLSADGDRLCLDPGDVEDNGSILDLSQRDSNLAETPQHLRVDCMTGKSAGFAPLTAWRYVRPRSIEIDPLLISPFEVGAEARGFNRLANAEEALGRYQGLVGAARRSWAKDNEKDLVEYIRAYVAALDWLFDPANKLEALAVFRKNLPNMSEDLANKSYEIMLHPTKGFTRRAELDVEGVQTVLQLRSEYAEPRKPLGEPAKYYDLQYYNQVRSR